MKVAAQTLRTFSRNRACKILTVGTRDGCSAAELKGPLSSEQDRAAVPVGAPVPVGTVLDPTLFPTVPELRLVSAKNEQGPASSRTAIYLLAPQPATMDAAQSCSGNRCALGSTTFTGRCITDTASEGGEVVSDTDTDADTDICARIPLWPRRELAPCCARRRHRASRRFWCSGQGGHLGEN